MSLLGALTTSNVIQEHWFARTMSRAENINPAQLQWARETAGLSLDEAAERIGLSDGKTQAAGEKLAELEAGTTSPTRVQLLKIAAVYRRPLTAFYLAQPPAKARRGEDFRTVRGHVPAAEDAKLDALLRDIRARHALVRSIVEDDEEGLRADFVGSLSSSTSIHVAADLIRQKLGYNGAGFATGFKDRDALFADLRERAERLGVLVLLIGNLGSHHSAIGEDVFRGFTIADKLAPFIVINDQDAKSARSFTLMHELVHLFLGVSGISGAPRVEEPVTSSQVTERFCDRVASEVLLPESSLPVEIGGDYQRAVQEAASRWNISEPMVAYRFHQRGLIEREQYSALVSSYAARWREQKDRDRAANREKDGGPNSQVLKKYSLGKSLVGLVYQSVRGDVLTHTKAAKVLGVKPGSVEPLLRTIEAPSAPRRARGAR